MRRWILVGYGCMVGLIVNRSGLVWKSGSYFVPNPKHTQLTFCCSFNPCSREIFVAAHGFVPAWIVRYRFNPCSREIFVAALMLRSCVLNRIFKKLSANPSIKHVFAVAVTALYQQFACCTVTRTLFSGWVGLLRVRQRGWLFLLDFRWWALEVRAVRLWFGGVCWVFTSR
jgi:hypothetical protein